MHNDKWLITLIGQGLDRGVGARPSEATAANRPAGSS